MSEQTKPWVESRLPVSATLQSRVAGVLRPRDLPYSATLGVLVMGAVGFLVLSGLVLSLYYNPWHAFDSIQFITREVNYGWLIRGFHSTGTTMLFATVYLVFFRALLSREYKAPGEIVWFLKIALLLTLLLVGYLGYTLADGAESYWSLYNAALTASRLDGIPGAVGNWVFGGPETSSTLARIAVLHGALAFLVVLVLAIHFAAKRAITLAPARPVAVHPYYTAQYFVAFCVFALIFAILVFFAPHLGQNPLNFAAPAGGLVVPPAVSPPWYLLPEAGLSRVLGGPLGAIISFIGAFAVLAALPWLDQSRPGTLPSFRARVLTYVLALDIIALCLTETAAPSALSGILTAVFIAWYYLHFLVLTPLLTASETK
jgi:ubiquinol-cytochrome c reductase cytochrome b/c1 subunit